MLQLIKNKDNHNKQKAEVYSFKYEYYVKKNISALIKKRPL